MTESVTVPRDVYESLVDGRIAASAASLSRQMEGRDRDSGLVLDPSFCRYLVWLWTCDRNQAVRAVAYLLVDVRNHPGAVEMEPPFTVAELVRALWIGLPADFEHPDALIADIRDHITGYYADA